MWGFVPFLLNRRLLSVSLDLLSLVRVLSIMVVPHGWRGDTQGPDLVFYERAMHMAAGPPTKYELPLGQQ